MEYLNNKITNILDSITAKDHIDDLKKKKLLILLKKRENYHPL